MGTVPNRERPSLMGKGALLVSVPRNHTVRVETVAGREAGAWSDGVEVGPPSNVTIRVKSSLNREGPPLPPVVRRCLGGAVAIAWLAPLIGSEVFEKQRTGRVAQVGAALRLFGDERGRTRCKAVASSFLCAGGTAHNRDDERADG
jgi:hypothetical protein